MPEVAKWKHDEVKKITDIITNSKVVGVVEIGGIPAPQMQKMRKNLRGNAVVRSSRNTLIERALDNADKKLNNVSGLKESLNGQAAIIATDMNPFKLFKKIQSSRTMAPAKGGDIAPSDIKVEKGDTPFKPGPIVGDLQKAGIPAAIQKGKVVIKKDKVIVKEGEEIPNDVAQILTRLEIHPMEIGMELKAVYEDGNLFTPDILDIDIEEFTSKMQNAAGNAFKLAVETGWTNAITVKPLISKAYNNAFSLALETGIINKKTIKHLISKASSQMEALKNMTS